MSIANMTTEWGALAGVFPFDEVLRDYLYQRADFLKGRSSQSPAAYARGDVEQWWAERDRWQADADATRSSSGFHRAASPRNSGAEEPAMSGLPPERIVCSRPYALYPEVPLPRLPSHSTVAWKVCSIIVTGFRAMPRTRPRLLP